MAIIGTRPPSGAGAVIIVHHQAEHDAAGESGDDTSNESRLHPVLPAYQWHRQPPFEATSRRENDGVSAAIPGRRPR
jgi:hypothetical protein